MSVENSRLALKSNIDDSVQQATQLAALLDNEYSALDSQDDQRLRELLPEKQNLVSTLDSLDHQRDALLQTLKPNMDKREDTEAVLRSINSALYEQWQHFLGIAESCQQRNFVNGVIIHTRQSQMNAALTILRGGELPTDQTYDLSGRQPANATTRTIGHA